MSTDPQAHRPVAHALAQRLGALPKKYPDIDHTTLLLMLAQVEIEARDSVRQARPLAKLSPADLAERLRSAGMHAPSESSRGGVDALSIRADLNVGDALENAQHALWQVISMLRMLYASKEADDITTGVAWGAADLACLAAGNLAVVVGALFSGEGSA